MPKSTPEGCQSEAAQDRVSAARPDQRQATKASCHALMSEQLALDSKPHIPLRLWKSEPIPLAVQRGDSKTPAASGRQQSPPGSSGWADYAGFDNGTMLENAGVRGTPISARIYAPNSKNLTPSNLKPGRNLLLIRYPRSLDALRPAEQHRTDIGSSAVHYLNPVNELMIISSPPRESTGRPVGSGNPILFRG